jgi:hypothetical protein
VFSTKGQGIRFQLIRKDFCTGLSHIDSTGYSLIDKRNDTTYSAFYLSKNGVLSLPRVGTYFISTYYIDSLFTDIKIEIKDTGLFVYNFKEPKLGGEIDPTIVDPFLQYITCGHLANGYQEDFYANGNFRIRGNFVNGRPLDSVITFYSNGAPETRRTYFKKQVVIEKYDSLFNLVELSKKKRGYYLSHYKKTFFFANKKIKLKENRKKGICKLKEYYANGNIKTIQTETKRIEYYPNKKTSCSYKWQRVKDATTNDFKFIIYKTALDSNGKIEEQQVYEYWFYNDKIYQPNLDINKSDWIVLWRKEKDGVATTICEDMLTKDYFKQ